MFKEMVLGAWGLMGGYFGWPGKKIRAGGRLGWGHDGRRVGGRAGIGRRRRRGHK